MKAVLIFLILLIMAGSANIIGLDRLSASEATESEGEIIEDSNSELEGIEGEENVDMDDYLRVLEEERQGETEFEDQGEELNEDEKEYPNEKYVDDRG